MSVYQGVPNLLQVSGKHGRTEKLFCAHEKNAEKLAKGTESVFFMCCVQRLCQDHGHLREAGDHDYQPSMDDCAADGLSAWTEDTPKH